MKQLILSAKRPAQIIEVPSPALKRTGVIVQTHFSAVSIGTERIAATNGHMNLIQKARSRPDQVQQVLSLIKKDGVLKAYENINDTLERWNATGYSSAGKVVALGTDISEFRIGDRVACAGGDYASHAEFCMVPRRLLTHVPENVVLEEAAFTTIGAIAMQGVRQGEVSIGDRVAIIGLGLVGQLTCQIAAAAGGIVTAIDLQPRRVELALQLGASTGIIAGQQDEVNKAKSLTSGYGYDVVLITAATASSDPVQLAARIARDRGRLVVVGDVGLNLERQTMYSKELDLRLSRSYGPGRYDPLYEEQGIDYPYGYIRWTEQRNMEAFLALLSQGRIKVSPLVSHHFSIQEAEKAYEILANPQRELPLGILLTYPNESKVSSIQQLSVAAESTLAKSKKLGVGVTGIGSFARSVLLPALRSAPVVPIGVVSSKGVAATQVANKYKFSYVSTEFDTLLSDPHISTIFITTPHSSHAELTIKCLEAGKAVFVEKPLATTLEDLFKIIECQRKNKGQIMVGFNRRFAPFTKRVQTFFGAEHGPLVLSMRINAGSMEKHWSLSASEGGRIIGEVCHFIDFLQYIVNAPVCTIYAQSVPTLKDALEENICATLTFTDGSVATLNYNALGNSALSKEYFEVFGDGKVAIIDDFSVLRLISHKQIISDKTRQNKGHNEEIQEFCLNLLQGKPCPIPFGESVATTLATFALLESCRTGEPVKIQDVKEE